MEANKIFIYAKRLSKMLNVCFSIQYLLNVRNQYEHFQNIIDAYNCDLMEFYLIECHLNCLYSI